MHIIYTDHMSFKADIMHHTSEMERWPLHEFSVVLDDLIVDLFIEEVHDMLLPFNKIVMIQVLDVVHMVDMVDMGMVYKVDMDPVILHHTCTVKVFTRNIICISCVFKL